MKPNNLNVAFCKTHLSAAHGHGHIYVGVSNFFGETSCLYLHAIRYRSGGTSPPTLNFWPAPTCGHGRVAMGMSLATFYRAWPWTCLYVGVSYFFGGTSRLYLYAEISVCWGTSTPQRYISGLGDQSPPKRPRVAMAGPPWP